MCYLIFFLQMADFIKLEMFAKYADYLIRNDGCVYDAQNEITVISMIFIILITLSVVTSFML